MQGPSHSTDRQSIVVLPMSRMDISDYLGLTIETVSRTITAMTKAGVIAVEGRSRIEIQDFEILEELAAGNSERSV